MTASFNYSAAILMKYIDEYRDPAVVRGLIDGIGKRAAAIGRPVGIMEVCGSHTMAIGRFGIRNMLPVSIRLISGPGCPVCVTSVQDVDRALQLAGLSDVVFATFGDMIRVPGTAMNSLQKMRAAGADIRVVTSAAQCVGMAQQNPDRHIVFMGIGFETTSPTVASTIVSCRRHGLKNVSFFSVHKLIPPAIQSLISDSGLAVDGFMCPGHVSTIIGAAAYEMIPLSGRAAVITGFEPVDILEGIYMLLGQMLEGAYKVEIQYARGVHSDGNRRAVDLLSSVFRVSDTRWRGIGTIPESGLAVRDEYAEFDSVRVFDLPPPDSREVPGCRCGDVLRGVIAPPECGLFKTVCTPHNPMGPCMVSSEGTCSAYYRFH